MNVLRHSALLIVGYLLGWLLLLAGLYAAYHTTTNVTEEIIAYYEKLFLCSFIYLVTTSVISIIFSIYFRIKKRAGRFRGQIIFTLFSMILFTYLFVFHGITIILYKITYLLDLC